MPQYEIKLIEKKEIAHQTIQYRFEKPAGFSFQAGQHMVMKQDVPLSDEETGLRSMTIASAPHEKHLDFVMRHSDSAFKQALCAMEPGERLTVFGPAGTYVLPDEATDPLLMVAGGVGMATFRSMIADMVERSITRDVVVIYSNPTQKDITFRSELDQWHSEGILRVHYVLTRETTSDGLFLAGHIDSLMFKRLVPDFQQRKVYICGGVEMSKAVRAEAIQAGAEEDGIYVELYTGYSEIDKS